jgi:cobalt-zinc-cadmium resistance protein CzcA
VGTNNYINARYYHGFEAGVAVPLFFQGQSSKIKASKIAVKSVNQSAAYELELLQSKQKELLNSLQKIKERMDNYNKSGMQLYDEIIRTSKLSYDKGEIDFFRWATTTETAMQLKVDQLNNLKEYSLVVLELNYLSK